MGAKYEVRWSINRKCQFSNSLFTNDLEEALAAYKEAVMNGNTYVELSMHDCRECPDDCKDRENLGCDAND